MYLHSTGRVSQNQCCYCLFQSFVLFVSPSFPYNTQTEGSSGQEEDAPDQKGSLSSQQQGKQMGLMQVTGMAQAGKMRISWLKLHDRYPQM